MSPGDIWEKSAPGRGNSTCKGPEAGVCLVCWRNSKESGSEPGGRGRDEVRELCRALAFILREAGAMAGF